MNTLVRDRWWLLFNIVGLLTFFLLATWSGVLPKFMIPAGSEPRDYTVFALTAVVEFLLFLAIDSVWLIWALVKAVTLGIWGGLVLPLGIGALWFASIGIYAYP